MTEQTHDRAAYVRTMLGMTQDQAAEAAGLSVVLLRDYEAGLYTLMDDEFAQLATALGVDRHVLTGAAGFAQWRGSRSVPSFPDATILGLARTHMMRVDIPVFEAFAASSIEELNRQVNVALEAIEPRESLLMVSPVTVAASDDDGNRLYVVSIVYSQPEAVHD